MRVQLLWGCDPARQFETAWLRHLFGPALTGESPWWASSPGPADLEPGVMPVLVESGLLRLERAPAPERLVQQAHGRQARLAALQHLAGFGVIHLSDEEGFDAPSWYGLVPPQVPIWRNFWHPHLEANPQVRSFPIGPRELFLSPHPKGLSPASQRSSPWAFMGTLWPSGSRWLAVSLFLRGLPAGLYFGGQHFGQGLPLEHYRANLLASVFALAPEGDRHLDTFRLWESLCCGCIPLLVEHRGTADLLLGAPHPLPVFASWPEALAFAQSQLADPAGLDAQQARIQVWWQRHQQGLGQALRDSLLRAQGQQLQAC
uniref:hypothetical protein n=1 Tax=Cyanobium sp. TaxID=2164130 RepID=UPI004047FE6F